MKRIITIAVIALAFTSCRKDYTCDCEYNDLVHGWTNETHSFQWDDKKEAKELCEDEGMGVYNNGFKCELR
ncbi:MAG: hypothetical protein KGY51_12105 [Psychroflexus sp.]|nr:hypothetical protein [Psychroflexus sp.]